MTKQFSIRLCLAITVLQIVGITSPAFARGPASATAHVKVNADVPEVESAIMDWKEAVEGADVNAIAALYDKNAIMISTFVQAPLTTRTALLGYYKKVIANPDVRVEIEEEHPRHFGSMAVNTGRYTLSYTQEGEEVVVPARFSFTYQLQGKKWVIVDHHSSAVPTSQTLK